MITTHELPYGSTDVERHVNATVCLVDDVISAQMG
jgi:hypothetical protein